MSVLIDRFDRDESPIPNRARARYRSPGFHQKNPWLPSLTSVLPQRPAFDQQRSKLDNEDDDENEHDSERPRNARAYRSDAQIPAMVYLHWHRLLG